MGFAGLLPLQWIRPGTRTEESWFLLTDYQTHALGAGARITIHTQLVRMLGGGVKVNCITLES